MCEPFRSAPGPVIGPEIVSADRTAAANVPTAGIGDEPDGAAKRGRAVVVVNLKSAGAAGAVAVKIDVVSDHPECAATGGGKIRAARNYDLARAERGRVAELQLALRDVGVAAVTVGGAGGDAAGDVAKDDLDSAGLGEAPRPGNRGLPGKTSPNSN